MILSGMDESNPVVSHLNIIQFVFFDTLLFQYLHERTFGQVFFMYRNYYPLPCFQADIDMMTPSYPVRDKSPPLQNFDNFFRG